MFTVSDVGAVTVEPGYIAGYSDVALDPKSHDSSNPIAARSVKVLKRYEKPDAGGWKRV